MQQVSDFLRSELSVVKDTQSAQATQISESVTETMSGFSQQVNENLARVEASLEKILDKEGKPEGRKPRADRGWVSEGFQWMPEYRTTFSLVTPRPFQFSSPA